MFVTKEIHSYCSMSFTILSSIGCTSFTICSNCSSEQSKGSPPAGGCKLVSEYQDLTRLRAVSHRTERCPSHKPRSSGWPPADIAVKFPFSSSASNEIHQVNHQLSSILEAAVQQSYPGSASWSLPSSGPRPLASSLSSDGNLCNGTHQASSQ